MLFYNTVNESLKNILEILMNSEVFNQFRLVGGTALSLQLGHRVSVDIDLFSDVPYGSIDFNLIDSFLDNTFPSVDYLSNLNSGLGKSYYIESGENISVKLDVFYTDKFIFEPRVENGIRMATLEEIAAMKLDVIQRGGRKKDYWDIHEILNQLDLKAMLALHKKRYPYNSDAALILKNMVDFEMAEEDFNPNCLLGKHWEFIKEDLIEFVNNQN